MATLIVPDVHEQIPHLKNILKNYDVVERVVFLGDFVDSFQHSEMITQTGEWLRENIGNPKYDFIWGNHDMHYAFPYGALMCSGWTRQKNFIYRSYVRPDQWERFQLHYWVGDWLCTHAGWHPSLLHPILGYDRDALKSLDKATIVALHTVKDGQWAPTLLQAGKRRGGHANVGGVTWLDWEDFEPVPGLNQIVGHTPRDKVRIKESVDSVNYCIDTNLNHVALIEDNKIRIEEV